MYRVVDKFEPPLCSENRKRYGQFLLYTISWINYEWIWLITSEF